MARTGESSIVAKCATVMDIVTRARQPLPFSEIATQAGFVKSSCHRILAVLQAEEMVAYDKPSRRYRAGPRLGQWAQAVWHRADLQDVAAEAMDRLSEETGMNTALSILDGESILYLRTSDHLAVRFAGRAGDHAPLHCTAAGKVFLAHMSPRRQREVIGALNLETFTEFTKTSADELIAELIEVAAQGYALALREEYLQVMGSAAPIRNAQGQIAAALSMWTMTSDATAAQLEQRAPLVMQTAASISEQIGWSEGRAPVS